MSANDLLFTLDSAAHGGCPATSCSVLNLYAGLGGNRKHWNAKVTAVERQPDIAAAYAAQYQGMAGNLLRWKPLLRRAALSRPGAPKRIEELERDLAAHRAARGAQNVDVEARDL